VRRLLLVGDVHAEDVRLAAALDHAAGSVDGVLCVGDIVDGPGDVARCIALLDASGAIVVRGNHDRWASAGRPLDPRGHAPAVMAWLSALPATREVTTAAGPLLLCHGVGDDDMVRLLPDSDGYALASNDALQALIAARRHRFVVAGHTHRRMVRRFGDLVVVNAGTLAGDAAGCAILDLDRGAVDFLDLTGPAVLHVESVPLFPAGLGVG
jgi:predicted phosphodiesterase